MPCQYPRVMPRPLRDGRWLMLGSIELEKCFHQSKRMVDDRFLTVRSTKSVRCFIPQKGIADGQVDWLVMCCNWFPREMANGRWSGVLEIHEQVWFAEENC
jgi:hypothetical protein